MRETFGNMPTKKPEGALRQVVFPELALMGVKTGDGRMLSEDGRGVRDLPRTIYGQFENAEGHSRAPIVGTLHEVSFEDGVASGRGWLINNEHGKNAVLHIASSALRHNSVDLAEVSAEFVEEDDDVTLVFTNWKIAATTLVGKPAFANASIELMEDEELVASWMEDETPLIVDVPLVMGMDVVDEELVADGAPLPPWDMFHIPETETPQKLLVGAPDDQGFVPVSGHLALWDSCHDGVVGRCTRVPRPDDNYASYNKPGVLTDQGIVGTGPIFLNGGHKKAPNGDYESAYGSIENTWADVRVTAGKLGPWLSGYVRPGIDDAQVLAARASRISGHWKGSRLKAIVSVNAEGFDVPGDGFSLDDEGHVSELVASFPTCAEPDLNQLTITYEGGIDPTFTTATGQASNTFTINGPVTFGIAGKATTPNERLRLALAFTDEDE